MKPTFFFDYIYYRVTKAYFKWDGRTGITAIIVVTMIQVFPLQMISMYFVRNAFDDELRKSILNLYLALGGIAFIGVVALNYRKYNGRYNTFRKYWQNETVYQRSIKASIVLMLIISSFLCFVLLNYLPPFDPIFHKD